MALRGASSADDDLLAALGRLRGADGRFVQERVEFLPKAWRAWVLDDGRVQRTRMELGSWFVLRDALRAGWVFRPVGRRYADPAGFLMLTARCRLTGPSSRSHSDARWVPRPSGTAPREP
ncbi:MAG: hypothetical protein M3Y17_03860 [Actinomycetota bacterium]|nr:hypothetical protein [Actinomycetota bacterium]